jgi:hypothetical protein
VAVIAADEAARGSREYEMRALMAEQCIGVRKVIGTAPRIGARAIAQG